MLAYDAYIVGADTVWTPLKIHDVEAEMFYLDFAKYIYAFLFNDLPGAMEMVNELSERTGPRSISEMPFADSLRSKDPLHLDPRTEEGEWNRLL